MSNWEETLGQNPGTLERLYPQWECLSVPPKEIKGVDLGHLYWNCYPCDLDLDKRQKMDGR